MIVAGLAREHLNLFLCRSVDPILSYEGGCILVRRRVSIGMATAVVVPAQHGDELVLNVPFDQIRGEITRGLLGPLVKALWNGVAETVRRNVAMKLHPLGFPGDTVRVDKERGGGRICISLSRVNWWLQSQWPELCPRIVSINFETHGMIVALEVGARARR